MLTCSMMRFLSCLLLGLCGVSSTLCCGCGDCDACTVVCVACVCCARVMAMLVWGPGEVW